MQPNHAWPDAPGRPGRTQSVQVTVVAVAAVVALFVKQWRSARRPSPLQGITATAADSKRRSRPW